MTGCLNLFQATMLQWRDLHPYNAAHAVLVAGALDATRLSAAIATHLEGAGLTGLEVDAARCRYRYRGGPATVALTVIPAVGDAGRAVAVEIERQLNAGFPATGRIDPFRFFAVTTAASFHLGVAYDHFVAGGDSIAVLLHDVAARYAGGAAAPAPDVYPATYAQLFRRHAVALLRGLPQLPAIAASCRRSFRPRYADSDDGTNGFVHVRVEATAFAALRRVAEGWGVTTSDVLLALMHDALSPLAIGRRSERRRTLLGVAMIVNVRRDFQPDARAAFGQFLSSIRVAHAVPDGIGIEVLARDIHAETARSKRRKLYLQTLVGVAVGALAWRFLSPARRARFHAKNYPVWGGLTPIDADALWRTAGSTAPAPDYIRGVSTGPLTPIVVAATVAGGALSLGLTFRTTAFAREVVNNVAATMLHRIHELAAEAPR
ncbi:MAG: hypothetical protein ABI886_03990 [Betaproteobacteria bacterium]